MSAWETGFTKVAGLGKLFKKITGGGAARRAPTFAAELKATDKAFVKSNPVGGYGKLHPEGVSARFNVSGNQMKKDITKTKYTDIK